MKNVLQNPTINKLGVKAAKAAPDVLVFAGIGGLIFASVSAYKKKTKAEEILTETREVLDKIETVKNDEATNSYSEADYRKDIVSTYLKTGIGLVKTFAVPVTVGLVSTACILKSHGMLKERNAALTAAYAVANESFNRYKDRVVESIGEEKEKELRYGVFEEEAEVVETTSSGKEKTVKKKVKNFKDEDVIGPYARFFDEGCPDWTKDPELNLMFLRHQEAYANDLLKIKGILFLNEVYKTLGLPETKAGQVVGWVYDPKNPVGDNFVDFGIYDIRDDAKRAFVNGHERSILLDFNVDGVVWDLMND